MAARCFIGLAAGPSADGVDAVLVEVEGRGLELRARLLHWLTEPFARELRELVIKSSTPGQADVRQVSLAHRLLGETFGLAARQVADRASVSLQKVLCVGCSGHTAWHDGDGRFPTTLSLGAPSVIAERTSLTTIADFRWRDLAAAGQGAPLGLLVDELLFRDPLENRLLIHLGGLAQAAFLPAGDSPRHALAWELGPGTVLLDCLMQQLSGGKERHDGGGKHAVQGRQLPELLDRWRQHPFLLRRPPKSAHRHLFGEEFVRQSLVMAQQQSWGSHDLLCTATHLVAQVIGDGVQRLLPKPSGIQRILLSGGGTRNGLLWRLLEERFPGVRVEKTDAVGIAAEARAAVQAAVLACLTLDGVPASVPRSTGAVGARLLGSLTPGSPANWRRCLAWMTGQESDLLESED